MARHEVFMRNKLQSFWLGHLFKMESLLASTIFFSVPVQGESLRVSFSLCFQSPAIKLDRSTGQPT